MTKREFLNAVITGNVNEETTAFAQNEIEKMNATAAKRAAKPSKTALENAPLVDRVVNEILTNEFQTATQVAEILDVHVQKATSLLKTAVEQGRARVTDVKVPKRGMVKAYALPEVDEAE